MNPVLYAEDEPDDVWFMQHAWETAAIGNRLVAVSNGQQALDYLAGRGPFSDREQHPLPCLLLLDLKLPVKSGFEVLHWVRAQPEFHDLKVVILSGSEQSSDVTLARAFGVVDYIVKPASPARLVEILQERKTAWLAQA